MSVPGYVPVKAKGWEQVPTRAILDAGMGPEHVMVYTVLRERSVTGKNFATWSHGSTVALPRFHLHLSIESDCSEFGMSASKFRRLIRDLAAKCFITLKTRPHRGAILEFTPLSKIPACKTVYRMVKEETDPALRSQDERLFNPDFISNWRKVKETLEEIRRSNPKYFQAIFNVLSESFGGNFGGSDLLHSDNSSDTERVAHRENSPASAGPESLLAAFAAGRDSVALNGGRSASEAAAEPLKAETAGEGEGWILPPSEYLEKINRTLGEARAKFAKKPKEHARGIDRGFASSDEIFTQMVNTGEFATGMKIEQNQLLVMTTSDNS